MTTEVQDKMKQVEERMQQLENRLGEVGAMRTEIGRLTEENKTTIKSVQAIDAVCRGIEPMIEQKVLQAANTLSTSLETKMDELGSRLLGQLGALGKKREGDPMDTEAKRQQALGLGGGKQASLHKSSDGSFIEEGAPH